MRHLWIGGIATMTLMGCVIDIHGGKWGIEFEDTGMDPMEGLDTGVTEADFSVEPDTLQPGITEVLTVTSEDLNHWKQMVSVVAIGDIEIIDSVAQSHELLVTVTVPEDAYSGAAHLVFEFADGEVYFARDVLHIEGLEEEELADTGLVDDETSDD